MENIKYILENKISKNNNFMDFLDSICKIYEIQDIINNFSHIVNLCIFNEIYQTDCIFESIYNLGIYLINNDGERSEHNRMLVKFELNRLVTGLYVKNIKKIEKL